MIHDGYWQNDLMVLSEEIGRLKKEINIELLNKTWGSSEAQEIQHKLSQKVFFSAAIIRKIIEEENAFVSFAKKYNSSVYRMSEDRELKPEPFYSLYKLQIPTIKIPITTNIDEDFKVFAGDYCIEDYELELGKKESYLVKDVSNWILHSYIWNLGSLDQERKIEGFFISSDFDKAKFVNYISFEVWINTIIKCAEEAYL